MDLNFQTESMVLFFLVTFSLTILPVKLELQFLVRLITNQNSVLFQYL